MKEIVGKNGVRINGEIVSIYGEYIFDEIYIWSDDKIEFSWEEWYWGGINYENREFENFENFKIFYENLKEY